MQQDVVTVGVDLANDVFQVHAIAVDGYVLVDASFGAPRY